MAPEHEPEIVEDEIIVVVVTERGDEIMGAVVNAIGTVTRVNHVLMVSEVVEEINMEELKLMTVPLLTDLLQEAQRCLKEAPRSP